MALGLPLRLIASRRSGRRLLLAAAAFVLAGSAWLARPLPDIARHVLTPAFAEDGGDGGGDGGGECRNRGRGGGARGRGCRRGAQGRGAAGRRSTQPRVG